MTTAKQIASTEFPRWERIKDEVKKQEQEQEKECPKECRCEVCRFWGA